MPTRTGPDGRLAVVARTLAAALVFALVLTGCATGGGDPVVESSLPAHDTASPAGPAYLAERLVGRRFQWAAVVDGDPVDLGSLDEARWLPDGNVLASRSTYKRSGREFSSTGRSLQVLDPATGELIGQRVGGGDWGVTPEAITVRHEQRNRIFVYSNDLAKRRVIDVPDSAVETDQIDPFEAEFHIHHAAYTLDGVTWVQWGINSEDDTLTDHGVLRIEGSEFTEVLRNEPVVSLRPSSDGAALLVLMQDNGESENCGGCVVEQTLIELDPVTGKVAAEYGMPDGYGRSWRMETVDKIGAEVVVRFAIGEAEEEGEAGVSRHTWVYDGDWTRRAELDETRTWWQQGGRLEWRQVETLRDEGEFAQMELRWLPDGGAPEELVGESHPCPEVEGVTRCPLIHAPGRLLPARAAKLAPSGSR